MAALGAPPPTYGHVPLWCDPQGHRLSKREAAEGVEGFRVRGLDAADVVGELAASVGLVPPGTRLSAADLLACTDPAGLSRVLAREQPAHSAKA
jgi:glutamyl-tRNA synthetase